MVVISSSILSDSEHFSPAHGTRAPGYWPTVLHRYGLGILHSRLGSTLHTVSLHYCTPPFAM